MYFACLVINAVYEVYPPKNKENANIYLSLKFCYRRSHTVKRGTIILYDAEPQMTVLAKVEKNRASRCKLDGKV